MFYRLLMKFGANVNQQTKSGDTPCHLAAYRGYSLIVQLLVEGGASLRVVNNKSRTPLEDAQSRGHTEIVRYISAVNKIRKYFRNLSKISPICMYFKKNYLLYFFGILLIIWLSESLIHSFIQLFGYLFDFKKTNFFISLLPRLWILQKDRLGVPDHLIHAKNAHVPEWQRQWLLLGRKSRPFLSSIRKQFIAFVPQGISIKNDLPESLTVPDLISMKTLERICAWHRWRAAQSSDLYWI